MKRIVKFIIVLGILFLVFQFGINMLKKEHTVDYKLKIGDKKIEVHEEYYRDKSDDYYFFRVTLDKKEFVFDINNLFNKQKKVISDIKIYEDDELTCISPVYIKNNDKADIVCNANNEQYSYTSIMNSYNLEEFTNTLDNFNGSLYEVNNGKESTIRKNLVYKDNMYNKENIIIYNYDELVKINKPSFERLNFSNYDVYQNKLGILIDKYYILPKYENKPLYSAFLIIDLVKENTNTLYFDDALSTNLYINGVVDNKLYFFDKSNLVQYEIDPGKESYRIVGNKSTNGQYYNGKWETRNIYNFAKQELEFINVYQVKDNYVEAFETGKYYYYYDKNNDFYKVYKKDLDNPIFLFNYTDAKEVQVVNDCIYFINKNTLYRYDELGIRTILTNKEVFDLYIVFFGLFY